MEPISETLAPVTQAPVTQVPATQAPSAQASALNMLPILIIVIGVALATVSCILICRLRKSRNDPQNKRSILLPLCILAAGVIFVAAGVFISISSQKPEATPTTASGKFAYDGFITAETTQSELIEKYGRGSDGRYWYTNIKCFGYEGFETHIKFNPTDKKVKEINISSGVVYGTDIEAIYNAMISEYGRPASETRTDTGLGGYMFEIYWNVDHVSIAYTGQVGGTEEHEAYFGITIELQH